MGQVCWPAAADGRYWIDLAVGNLDLLCMVDLGLVDPLNRLSLEIDPALYDQLQQARQFQRQEFR